MRSPRRHVPGCSGRPGGCVTRDMVLGEDGASAPRWDDGSAGFASEAVAFDLAKDLAIEICEDRNALAAAA